MEILSWVELLQIRKKSKITLKRNSPQKASGNPVTSICSGCRIKSGITNLGLFTRPSTLNLEL